MMTDTDLADTVERFYAEVARSLTPIERAHLANAIKVIRRHARPWADNDKETST